MQMLESACVVHHQIHHSHYVQSSDVFLRIRARQFSQAADTITGVCAIQFDKVNREWHGQAVDAMIEALHQRSQTAHERM